MSQTHILFVFILIGTVLGLFPSGASTSSDLRPRPQSIATPSKTHGNHLPYNFDNEDQENSQFQKNDFYFSLLPLANDDLSSSVTSTSTGGSDSTPSPTNDITSSKKTNNFNTINPSTPDISQTFTTSSVQQRSTTSQDIGPSTKFDKSTELTSTTSSTSTVPESQTDKGQMSTMSTPMPEEHSGHTMPLPEHLQHKNKSGTVKLRGACNTTDQCSGEHTECRIQMCKCQLGYVPRTDDGNLCGEARLQQMHPPQADPTMIGVVIGLVLMSFTLCVVMRLFAKARFQENRSIFNTPNPRLMNASLLKGPKALIRGNSAGQGSRRASQVSINSDGEGQGRGQGHSQPKESSRPRPHRQPSTDTATTISETGGGSRPISSNKQKSRPDSIASNSKA